MRTGFIGLGAMGSGMARNLHRAGLLVGVWNRSAPKAAALAAELQCTAAPDAAALARDCDALVLCVSADQDVLAVIAQVAPALRPGSLVIDCSTVSAATARAAATQLSEGSVEFLDAPVSGGIEGAAKATLAIMVGGEASTLERARPLLAAMGATITHFGPHGAGQAAKATNQIMVAGIIRANAEALAFARAQGLDLGKVVSTLSRGAGGSWYLANRGPYMERGEYPAGFRVRLHQKDLLICRAMAREVGATLPAVESALADYARLIALGCGDEDISSMYRLTAALFAPQAAA
ncbi:MAG: NAD(P)-dependent oxidoreductase [Steroidobacteraceae bacterium]